eukprot:6606807-Lingulodinium_polyedra.AAC.1
MEAEWPAAEVARAAEWSDRWRFRLGAGENPRERAAAACALEGFPSGMKGTPGGPLEGSSDSSDRVPRALGVRCGPGSLEAHPGEALQVPGAHSSQGNAGRALRAPASGQAGPKPSEASLVPL